MLDWNLRLSRTFRVPHWSIRLTLDVLNVTNAGNRIEESDLSGPAFSSDCRLRSSRLDSVGLS
jgi:hypothetical protein